MMRYLPFGFIWLLGIPFLIWLAVAPKIADERFWQVDAVTIKMGSSQIMNPTDQPDAAQANPSDASKQTSAPPAPSDTGLSSLSAWPDDGVKIKPLRPDFQEMGNHGPVPKIGADGTKPWQYYARPFPADNTQPRLAIIMRDMGLSENSMLEAISNLPGEITFAFSPYADNLAKSMQTARDRGHETLVELPLETQPGTGQDVGPRAYSSLQTPAVNQDNNSFILSNLLGSVGVLTDGGQRLVNNEAILRPLMQSYADRGLIFVDNTMQNETLTPLLSEQLKSPWARTMLRMDDSLSSDAMDVMMGKAVQLAKQNGRVLIVAGASPLTRSVIANWAHRLPHDGVVLAPLSAVTTEGSAAQTTAASTSTPPSAPAAPGALLPHPDNMPPADTLPADKNTAPINLLNPAGPNGAPAPNILDPSKPVQTVNPNANSSAAPAAH